VVPRLPPLSLRTKVFATALVVAFPAASIIVYSSLRARAEALRDATLETEHLADEIAHHHQNLVAGAEQLLVTLTQLPDIRSGEAARVHALLGGLLRINSQYTNLLVASASGRVWAQALDGPPFEVADRLYFRSAVASGRLAAGEYVVSRSTGRPTFNLAVPFFAAPGELAGVIIAGIELRAIRRLVNLENLPPGAGYLLLDHRGLILTRDRAPEQVAGRPLPAAQLQRIVDGPDLGAWTGSLLEDDGLLVSYRKLRLAGEARPHLYALAAIPVAPALSRANRALLGDAALLTPFLLLAAALAWLLGERSIGRPVRLLERASRRVAGGDLQVRVADLVQGGELGALARTFDDMSRQLKERELALRQSEELYRQLFEVESDALFLVEQETGRILEVNPAASHLLGYARDELLGMRDVDLSADPAALRRQVSVGSGRNLVEAVFRHRDGAEIPSEAAATFFTLRGRGVMLAALRDLRQRQASDDERRKLQDQLLQAQKMESVGRLAGGIAHDFNNLVTVINGHCDLLGERPELTPAMRQDLQLIRQAGESAAALTRQLLAFSRKQLRRPQALDLNDLVVRMDRMLRRVIGEDVRLETRLEPKPWAVLADPGQLEQVVMNLAVNARDAMPRGGTLTLATANVLLDEGYARTRRQVQPGEHVLLSVSDTGAGMDAATLAQIFEPFFTTKPEGQGTGLGLSTVYGIVAQSGGHVAAYSEPGHGTTIRVYLPRAHGAPAEAPQPAAPPDAAPAGATVLVAEDSEGVRSLVREVLSRHGFTVLEARHGEEALEVARRHQGAIHLLLTDVVMPGQGGRQMAERLLALRPGLPVIYMSGYTEDAILSQGLLQASIHFIEKPFTANALLVKVSQVLEQQRAHVPGTPGAGPPGAA